MKKQDIDEVLAACVAWVQQHHRAVLTPSEASQIRRKLMALFQMSPNTEQLEYVSMAHRMATIIVNRRRDGAQVREHQWMARA